MSASSGMNIGSSSISGRAGRNLLNMENMNQDEISRKERQKQEYQRALLVQMEEKKRQKEAEKLKEMEEARKEEDRLQLEAQKRNQLGLNQNGRRRDPNRPYEPPAMDLTPPPVQPSFQQPNKNNLRNFKSSYDPSPLPPMNPSHFETEPANFGSNQASRPQPQADYIKTQDEFQAANAFQNQPGPQQPNGAVYSGNNGIPSFRSPPVGVNERQAHDNYGNPNFQSRNNQFGHENELNPPQRMFNQNQDDFPEFNTQLSKDYLTREKSDPNYEPQVKIRSKPQPVYERELTGIKDDIKNLHRNFAQQLEDVRSQAVNALREKNRAEEQLQQLKEKLQQKSTQNEVYRQNLKMALVKNSPNLNGGIPVKPKALNEAFDYPGWKNDEEYGGATKINSKNEKRGLKMYRKGGVSIDESTNAMQKLLEGSSKFVPMHLLENYPKDEITMSKIGKMEEDKMPSRLPIITQDDHSISTSTEFEQMFNLKPKRPSSYVSSSKDKEKGEPQNKGSGRYQENQVKEQAGSAKKEGRRQWGRVNSGIIPEVDDFMSGIDGKSTGTRASSKPKEETKTRREFTALPQSGNAAGNQLPPRSSKPPKFSNTAHEILNPTNHQTIAARSSSRGSNETAPINSGVQPQLKLQNQFSDTKSTPLIDGNQGQNDNFYSHSERKHSGRRADNFKADEHRPEEIEEEVDIEEAIPNEEKKEPGEKWKKPAFQMPRSNFDPANKDSAFGTSQTDEELKKIESLISKYH